MFGRVLVGEEGVGVGWRTTYVGIALIVIGLGKKDRVGLVVVLGVALPLLLLLLLLP